MAAGDRLVTVDLGNGRGVKVRRPRAVDKRRRTALDKRRRPPENKTAADFTRIPGVGASTAAQIEAAGIRTFAQLRTADLGFLSSRAAAAVEAWRHG